MASVSESQTPWQIFGIFLKGLLSECCKSVVNFMGHFQLGSWSSLCLRCIHAPFCRGWKGASKDQSKDHSKGPKGKNGTKGGSKADSAGERNGETAKEKGSRTGRLVCYWRICQIEVQIEIY